MDKTIYNYHPTSKVYVGSTLADESPLEPGVFLIPAHATETPPPPVTGGKKAVFSEETRKWIVQDTPAPLPLKEQQELKRSEIRIRRETVKSGGVKVGTKWFHTDDASRIQHMALNMMGASIPSNLQWKTMDGTFVAMTQTLAGQVFQAVATLDMTAFAKAEEHMVAMEAASDPSAYDFSSGWPQTYAETLVT